MATPFRALGVALSRKRMLVLPEKMVCLGEIHGLLRVNRPSVRSDRPSVWEKQMFSLAKRSFSPQSPVRIIAYRMSLC